MTMSTSTICASPSAIALCATVSTQSRPSKDAERTNGAVVWHVASKTCLTSCELESSKLRSSKKDKPKLVLVHARPAALAAVRPRARARGRRAARRTGRRRGQWPRRRWAAVQACFSRVCASASPAWPCPAARARKRRSGSSWPRPGTCARWPTQLNVGRKLNRGAGPPCTLSSTVASGGSVRASGETMNGAKTCTMRASLVMVTPVAETTEAVT